MAKKIYPSLDSRMLGANVEWKDGKKDKINIGKKFGIDGIIVTDFHLRFGLNMSLISALKIFYENSH